MPHRTYVLFLFLHYFNSFRGSEMRQTKITGNDCYNRRIFSAKHATDPKKKQQNYTVSYLA